MDDDEILQKLLQQFLRQQGYWIDSLFDGDAMNGFFEENHADLVVLDLLLPGKSGHDGLTWLQQRFPHMPVLILSAEQEQTVRVASLEAGAVDYLAKPFHPTELLIRIRNILRNYPPKIVVTKPIDYSYCFDAEHALFFRADQTIKLTTTENQLLKYLFEHIGEVVSRDAISETLYGSSHHLLDRSIDVHINRLRKKIEERPSFPKYLNTVWGKGYRFLPPKPSKF